MHAITSKNLRKSFREDGEDFFAVDGIDLGVNKGEIYGFLGPNGAGKTTTIYMLTTLLLPTSGRAEVLGYDIINDAQKIRENIGLCIGGTHLYYEMNPREILEFFGLSMGIPKDKRRRKTDELIKDLKMEEFRKKPFTELSTGMRQKVALAKALINEPAVLFLDEPTNGLDVEIAYDIRNYIRDIVDDTDMTVLLTSHHLYEVEELCKRISIINKGKIEAEGSIKDIRKKVDVPDIANIILNDYKNTAFLDNLDYVLGKRIDENGLSVRIRQGADNLKKLMDDIEKNGLRIEDIEIRKATLEEVFMKIVGGHDA